MVVAAPARTAGLIVAGWKGASSNTVAFLSKNTAISEAKPPPNECPVNEISAVGYASLNAK